MSSETYTLSDVIYCKGKLLGYSEPGKSSQTNGKITFSEFSWNYMHIDEVQVIGPYHSEALMVGDYWYRKVLKGKKNWWMPRQLIWKSPKLSWPKRPEILFQEVLPNFIMEPYTKSLFQILQLLIKGVLQVH